MGLHGQQFHHVFQGALQIEGDDLQIVDPTMIVENRVLVVQGTNDDITLGQDSPFEYSFLFDVESMVT